MDTWEVMEESVWGVMSQRVVAGEYTLLISLLLPQALQTLLPMEPPGEIDSATGGVAGVYQGRQPLGLALLTP